MAETVDVNPVPPVTTTVFPSKIVCVVTPSDNTQELIVPGVAPELAADNRPCASTVNDE